MTILLKVQAWALVIAASAAAGLVYDLTFSGGQRPLVAVVYGLFTGVPIFAFIRGLILQGLGRGLRRLAFPVYAPLAIILCVASIVASNTTAGTVLWWLGVFKGSYQSEVLHVPPTVIFYSLAVSAMAVFVARMSDLIGRDMFINLLLGRYHRPVREERVFLFIDVVGSTAFAEAFGDLRAQSYLGHFFASLTEPVRRFRGSIDDYVGDLAIITWPLAVGVAKARCVECVFSIDEVIAKSKQDWIERFGNVPRFRAALHCGPVVTADVGVDKHKIAYFGDTVNATARLEALSRELGAAVLVSGDLFERLPALAEWITVTALGAHAVRGRSNLLEVIALARRRDLNEGVANRRPEDLEERQAGAGGAIPAGGLPAEGVRGDLPDPSSR
jgi:adenylate cyclase